MIMAFTDELKDALASWASGVSVVATRVGGQVYGLTVSSFTSLSLEPPLVLVCLANRSRLTGMIRDAKAFTVSLLADDQHAASSYFATAGREPEATFGNIAEETTTSGMPAVKDAMAYVSCELFSQLMLGDHTIVVGKVVQAVTRVEREPLLYHRRRYRVLHGGEQPTPAKASPSA
jgi:flavin reductase (DIM6/NTAB) family NADH-FMN oxidoreductase RutF